MPIPFVAIGQVIWGCIKPFGNPMTWPALLLVFGLGFCKGKNYAESQCEAATLRAKIVALETQIATQKAADEQEEIDTAILAANELELEKQLEDYKDALAKKPARCAVTADDLKRMQP